MSDWEEWEKKVMRLDLQKIWLKAITVTAKPKSKEMANPKYAVPKKHLVASNSMTVLHRIGRLISYMTLTLYLLRKSRLTFPLFSIIARILLSRPLWTH